MTPFLNFKCVLFLTSYAAVLLSIPTVSGCDSNCDSCGGNGSCSVCFTGYFLRGENCLACIDDCNECTDEASCSICADGYYYQVLNVTTASGFYGRSCRNLCELCENGLCSKNECTIGCLTDYYRGGDGGCNDCSLCKGGMCSKVNCTHGCKISYFEDPTGGCQECYHACASCTARYNCNKCVPGKWGHQCLKLCKYCKYDVCDFNTGNCTKGCKDGSFPNSTICSPCPSGCSSCTSLLVCELCENGRWGTHCQSVCDNCRDNSCHKSTGICNYGCKGGYFMTPNNTCKACEPVCTKCISSVNCTSCIDGKYGEQCQDACDSQYDLCITNEHGASCINGTYGERCQYNCYSQCITCVSDLNCTACIEGRYGERCQNRCDSKCVSCVMDVNCTACIEGRYGERCQNRCDSKCKSCVSDVNCTACIEGRYGERCQDTCDFQYDSCITNEHGASCINGLYGERCQHKCDSHCITCVSDVNCKTCIEGRYGERCQNRCDSKCVSCISDVNCKACIEGRYGERCQNNCNSGCASCVSDVKCTACIEGRYGERCQDTCDSQFASCITSENGASCINRTYGGQCQNKCDPLCVTCVTDINCTTCIEGRYGERCQNTCDSQCVSCFSGVNCTTCIKGKYGERCQLLCGSECKACYGSSKTCTQCIEGHYLHNSSCHPCAATCSKCASSTECLECESGYYLTGNKSPGMACSKCAYVCSVCTSLRCSACQPGYYYYHDQCHLCPYNCISCTSQLLCDKCIAGYFGPICRDTCQVGYYLHGQVCLNCQEKCKDNTTCETSDGRTKNGSCLQACDDSYRDKICVEGPRTDTNGGYGNIYVYAGVGAALAVLVVGLLVAVKYKRKRQHSETIQQNAGIPGNNLHMDIPLMEIELANNYDLHVYDEIDEVDGDENRYIDMNCGHIDNDAYIHPIYKECRLDTGINADTPTMHMEMPNPSNARMYEEMQEAARDRNGHHDTKCGDIDDDEYIHPIYKECRLDTGINADVPMIEIEMPNPNNARTYEEMQEAARDRNGHHDTKYGDIDNDAYLYPISSGCSLDTDNLDTAMMRIEMPNPSAAHMDEMSETEYTDMSGNRDIIRGDNDNDVPITDISGNRNIQCGDNDIEEDNDSYIHPLYNEHTSDTAEEYNTTDGMTEQRISNHDDGITVEKLSVSDDGYDDAISPKYESLQNREQSVDQYSALQNVNK